MYGWFDLIMQLIALQHEHKELRQDHKALDWSFQEMRRQLETAKFSDVDPPKPNLQKVTLTIACTCNTKGNFTYMYI